MKVDTRPFPVMQVNGLRDAYWISRSTSIWKDHCDIVMRRRGQYIIEEQVRHMRYQWPLSTHLLKKYEY
jgi:hypothetical protein